MIVGRNFRSDEEPSTAPRVAIISSSLWKSHFGGDPSVLDRKLVLNDSVATIVGVLSPDYQPLNPGDIVMPLRFTDATIRDRGQHFLNIYGRLRAGLSVAEAKRQLIPLAAQVEKASSTDHSIAIASLKDDLTQGSSASLGLMFGAVGFVLLIGCANVANLLLARAAGRHREIAVRIALGAGRWRLVSQLLTESTLLALIGGALGLIVARGTLIGLLAALGPRLPRAAEISMDVPVLLFALGISLLTGILFGLAPARTLLRASLTPSLGEGGREGASAGKKQRNMLVAGEVALTLMLLIGAGLVLRSFGRLLEVPKGFAPDHVLTFVVNLSPEKYKTPAQQVQFFDQFRARLAALPGVDAAGFVNQLPLAGGNVSGGIDIEGRTFAQNSGPVADKRIASPGYFHAMHIPILRGREFRDADDSNAPHVAIINESFAQKYFAGMDPIGQYIAFNWDIMGFQEIVGVVGDVKHDNLASPNNSEVYVCYTQRPDPGYSFAVRTKTDPTAMLSSVRSTLASLDSGIPLTGVSGVFTLGGCGLAFTARSAVECFSFGQSWRARADLDGGWHLRSSGVQRCAADARAGNSHRAGSVAQRHHEIGAKPRVASGCDWRGRWNCGSFGADTFDERIAVRCETDGPLHVCGGHGNSACGGAGGVLDSGAACDARGSSGGVAVRVKVAISSGAAIEGDSDERQTRES